MDYYTRQLQHYFELTSPEQLEKDYQELASYGENSPTIDEYLQYLNGLPTIHVENDFEINPEDFISGFFIYIIFRYGNTSKTSYFLV